MTAPQHQPAALTVHLAKKRDKAVRQGHPWIFSGAIARTEGDESAPVARVLAASGEDLGLGFWSPQSQIRVRMLTGPAERPSAFPQAPENGRIDRAFFAQRLREALALRRDVLLEDTTGYRVLNAEGDGIPGWTVDRFGRVLVSQMTVAGLEAMADEAYGALTDIVTEHHPEIDDLVIVQNDDLPARRPEGLSTGAPRAIRGEAPDEAPFLERGLEFTAEIAGGQKTGFYCDQRENRARAESFGAGRTVLDLFAHTGGFALSALRGGAEHATLVESAPRMAERAAATFAANGVEPDRFDWVTADVFAHLREVDRSTRYGLVVADPPPLVRRKHDLDKGARAYKDLNRLALERVEDGGFFMTFTCSAAVDTKLFRQILFSAALEAGVRLSLLEPLAAAADHPVAVTHPQGEYLTGWLARVAGR